jgi:hypothetical protein
MKINNNTDRLRRFSNIEVGATFMAGTNCYVKLGDCIDKDKCHFNAYNFEFESFADFEDDDMVIPVKCELTVL